MALTTLQIVRSATSNFEGLLRTMEPVEILYDDEGELRYMVGNSAVTFCVKYRGRLCSMKCYNYSSPLRRDIYGDKLRENELYVYVDEQRGAWTDVVIDDWIEGAPLSRLLRRYVAQGRTDALHRLSSSFDALALKLLDSESAHGDITCDNIIVDREGELHLIDFDGAFIPSFAGKKSIEVGTAAFQHPLRSVDSFDRDIDDFSIALISSMLAAIAINQNLYYQLYDIDGFRLSPTQAIANRSAELDIILELFARQGASAAYRIARLLSWPHYALPKLRDYFAFKVGKSRGRCGAELFVDGYLWGYIDSEGEQAIPPLFDNGFDFCDGYAAVEIAGSWHYIHSDGSIAKNCSDCQMIKPARTGVGNVLRDGVWRKMPLD